MKTKMGILFVSVILLSATAFAAAPAKPVEKHKADFTATINPKMPLTVKFMDKSKGSPTSWHWDFGDKTKIVTTKDATHTYKKPGKYTVTLVVDWMKGKETSKISKVIDLKMKKM